MRRPQVAPFEADLGLRDLLRKECTVADLPNGEKWYCDVRWWPQGNCLAIYELDQSGLGWTPREALIDSRGWPRQITHRDVDEIRAKSAEARNAFDRHWYRRLKEHNEAVNEKIRAEGRDEERQIDAMSDEMKRRGHCWHGVRGDVDCKTCNFGKKRMELEAPKKARRAPARNLDARYSENKVSTSAAP